MTKTIDPRIENIKNDLVRDRLQQLLDQPDVVSRLYFLDGQKNRPASVRGVITDIKGGVCHFRDEVRGPIQIPIEKITG